MIDSVASFACAFGYDWPQDVCEAFILCVEESKNIASIIENNENWEKVSLVNESLPELHKKVLCSYVEEIRKETIPHESCSVELDVRYDYDVGELLFDANTSIMTESAAAFIRIFLREFEIHDDYVSIQVGYAGNRMLPGESGGSVWFITSKKVKLITTDMLERELISDFQKTLKHRK